MSDSALSREELSEVLLVDPTGQARLHYDVCHLQLEGGEPINLIPIVFVGDKLLVAVPQEVWSRSPSDRILPKGGLVRAILVEIAAASFEEPEVATEEKSATVWIGCLDLKLSKKIVRGRAEEALADVFQVDEEGQVHIPFALGLAEVAEEHFSFQTANEESELPRRRPALKKEDPVEQRFRMLEESMNQIQASLAGMSGVGAVPPKKRDKTGASPKPRAQAKEEKPEEIPGLDPGVVHSAREAGRGATSHLGEASGETQQDERRSGDRSQASDVDQEECLGRIRGRRGGPRGRGSRGRRRRRCWWRRNCGEGLSQAHSDRGQHDQGSQRQQRCGGHLGWSWRRECRCSSKFKFEREEQVCGLQEAPELFAGEPGLPLHLRGGTDGGGFHADPQGSGIGSSGYFKPSLDRTQEPNLELPEHDPILVDPGRDTRLLEGGGLPRSSCKDSPCHCSNRPGCSGCRQLGFSSRAAIRACSSLRLLPEQERARDLGTDEQQTGRRQVVGCHDVEAEGQGCLPGEQEAAEPRKRTRTRRIGPSLCREPDSQEASQTRERREEGWRKRGFSGSQQPAELNECPTSGARAPGSQASVVHGIGLWDTLFRLVSKGSSKLSLVWFSARTSTARSRAAEGVVWPMPLPFPELHKRGANRMQKDGARKIGLNYVILILNYLSGLRKPWREVCPPLGTPLNRQQWAVIKQFTPLIDEWNAEGPVGPSEMGRTAAKVESVEEVLKSLEQEGFNVYRQLRSYGGRGARGEKVGKDPEGFREEGESEVARGDAKDDRIKTSLHQRTEVEVLGEVSVNPEHLAKAVEPDRLKFWGEPSFEAGEYLDERNRASYLNPLAHARAADIEEFKPPRVSVRCKTRDKIKLLEKLDSGGRLGLLPVESVRMSYRNGLFGIPKDESRDRMILDARPPNLLEDSEDRWIKSLGSLAQLSHFFIAENEEIRIFAEDLREFYHAFLISRERLCRNALAMEVSPSEVSHLRCFDPRMRQFKRLVPALRTMAMGDTNAVAYGQTAHLACLLRTGVLDLEDFITLHSRPSRKQFIAGLMIDDFLLIEKRMKNGEEREEKTEGERIIEKVRQTYEDVGLPRHAGKAVYDSESASFWGAQVDGKAGRMRPNLKRVIPLIHLVIESLKIGSASVGLLEIFAGSFTSVFQLKRRYMACLDEVYRAQRGLERRSVVKMNPRLRDELFSAIGLAVITSVDFRLKPSSRVVCSDASSTSEAAVQSRLGPAAVVELQKHTLAKGMWNRLLQPGAAYLREKSLLEEQEELPGGESYEMHPAWEEVVSSLRFRPFGKVVKAKRRRHINVGELRAALRAEELHGRQEPSSFYLHFMDSQVCLAALAKGRSSSRSLNEELKMSIAGHAGQNVKAFYGFVRSKKNPADDPTRSVRIRMPQRAEAEWLKQLEEGRYELFDRFLETWGLDPSSTSELPPAEELLPREHADLRTSKVLKKKRKKERRRAEVEKRREDGGPRSGDPLDKRETGNGKDEAGEKEGDRPEPCLEECKQENEEVETAEREEGSKKTGEKEMKIERPGLSEEARVLLRRFPKDQFPLSKDFGGDIEKAFDSGAGFLDLFSGSRGVSKAMVKHSSTWSLCFDLKHHPSEDLLKGSLQKQIFQLLRMQCFSAMGAGPVCSSFSLAITPPCRNKEFPEGVPWASEKQQLKNQHGNEMLCFVLTLVQICLEVGVKFFVENPDGSWIWRQVGKMSWDKILEDGTVGDLRVDYCRFSTPWRKRTRFRTNTHLAHQKCFCRCNKKHIPLRGRCKARGVNYTALAEPYPRGICEILAIGLLIDSGKLPNRRKLNVELCAKCTHGRIGESKQPGPRRTGFNREGLSLAEVEVLEPATIYLREKIWGRFEQWFTVNFPGVDFLDWMRYSPSLFVMVLRAYGHAVFESNSPLYYYRQLLAHAQKRFPSLRIYMPIAWETVTKWELLEPVQHRPPLPEPILKAAAVLGLSWKWERWTSVLVFAFYSASRIGEVLRARRRDVLTPADLMTDQRVVYLRIAEPKTKKRGARTQYSTVDDPLVVRWLTVVWQNLMPDEFLYPSSPGAFRSRWDGILRTIGIGREHRLTPGSLRSGGTVFLHKNGVGITELLWRLRLQHVRTLSHYLQEITAESILPSLVPAVRHKVQVLQTAMPAFLESRCQQRTSCNLGS